MSHDEVGTLSRLKTLRRELFDPKTKQYGGRIFKTTGDGAFVEFNSAVEAVKSAAEIQKELVARNAEVSEDQTILLRIGISLGDVIVEGSDPDSVSGPSYTTFENMAHTPPLPNVLYVNRLALEGER